MVVPKTNNGFKVDAERKPSTLGMQTFSQSLRATCILNRDRKLKASTGARETVCLCFIFSLMANVEAMQTKTRLIKGRNYGICCLWLSTESGLVVRTSHHLPTHKMTRTSTL